MKYLMHCHVNVFVIYYYFKIWDKIIIINLYNIYTIFILIYNDIYKYNKYYIKVKKKGGISWLEQEYTIPHIAVLPIEIYPP